MSTLVTGATGYIGRAVANALVAGGHQVAGLARSAESAEQLRQRGIDPVAGDLDDAERLGSLCVSYDGVVHLAFGWKADVTATIAAERQVIEAMLRAMAGTGKPFVFASGTSVLGDTGYAIMDEEAAIAPHPLDERLGTERLVLEAERVRGVVIRAPNVYGRGDGKALFAALRQAGAALGAIPYPRGSGDNLWSFVHIDDLADLFVLALERAEPHQLFHAGAQSGLRTRDIAAALSRGAGWEGRTLEMPLAELRPLFPVAALADYWSQNGQSSREKAERLLGWRPRHLDMLREIAGPHTRAQS